MQNDTVRVETIEGEIIADGTQWITTIVNGVNTDLPIHVSPAQMDKARGQLEFLLRRVYHMGYKSGVDAVRGDLTRALGLSR